MSKLDMNEQVQILELKEFFVKYGKYFIGLIALAILAYLISALYNSSNQKKSVEAAEVYSTFLSAQSMKDDVASLSNVKKLQDNYKNTEFAAEASLIYAGSAFNNNKLDVATQMLNWVINNSNNKGYIDIARLRLANVYIDQKNFNGALKLLQEKHDPAFDGLYYLARGDLYIAQGNNNKARDAYKEALDKASQDASLTQVIQMRMQVLGQ